MPNQSNRCLIDAFFNERWKRHQYRCLASIIDACWDPCLTSLYDCAADMCSAVNHGARHGVQEAELGRKARDLKSWSSWSKIVTIHDHINSTHPPLLLLVPDLGHLSRHVMVRSSGHPEAGLGDLQPRRYLTFRDKMRPATITCHTSLLSNLLYDRFFMRINIKYPQISTFWWSLFNSKTTL